MYFHNYFRQGSLSIKILAYSSTIFIHILKLEMRNCQTFFLWYHNKSKFILMKWMQILFLKSNSWISFCLYQIWCLWKIYSESKQWMSKDKERQKEQEEDEWGRKNRREERKGRGWKREQERELEEKDWTSVVLFKITQQRKIK